MTADQLHKMQEECKKRHRAIFSMGVIMPVEEPNTFSKIIDEHFELKDEVLKPKKKPEKPSKIMPDLMADQLLIPSCESQNKEVISVSQKQQIMSESNKVWPTIFDKPHVPKPVQKKEIIGSKALAPDPPASQRKFERPKAEYSNTKSHYGIYDELKEEWNKKTG